MFSLGIYLGIINELLFLLYLTSEFGVYFEVKLINIKTEGEQFMASCLTMYIHCGRCAIVRHITTVPDTLGQ